MAGSRRINGRSVSRTSAMSPCPPAAARGQVPAIQKILGRDACVSEIARNIVNAGIPGGNDRAARTTNSGHLNRIHPKTRALAWAGPIATSAPQHERRLRQAADGGAKASFLRQTLTTLGTLRSTKQLPKLQCASARLMKRRPPKWPRDCAARKFGPPSRRCRTAFPLKNGSLRRSMPAHLMLPPIDRHRRPLRKRRRNGRQHRRPVRQPTLHRIVALQPRTERRWRRPSQK